MRRHTVGGSCAAVVAWCRRQSQALRANSFGSWTLPGAPRALAYIDRMSGRERRLVLTAGLALGLALVYLLVVEPVWQAHGRIRARVAAKERELDEVRELSLVYRRLHAASSRPPRSGAALSPFALLDNLARAAVGRDRVDAINPAGHELRNGVKEETIELRLKGVSLQQLVELLYKIDTAGAQLRTERLAVEKTYDDPYSFDVSLTTRAFSTR